MIFICGALAFFPGPLSAEQKEPLKLLAEAREAFREGKLDRASELYEAIIALNPRFAAAYYGLGLVYKEMNAPLPEIAWYFKTATEIDPKFVDAYDNLGKVYYGLGQFDKAEQSCLKALSINPDYLSAQLSLGWIYLLGESKPNEAIRYFQMVLSQAKIANAYLGLGIAYFMNKNEPMVLESITALRQMDEDSLAMQLEAMVRDRYYVPPEKAGPLVEPLSRPAEGPLITPPEGTLKVRLRGKLINPEIQIRNKEK